jgi:hypothetical protein
MPAPIESARDVLPEPGDASQIVTRRAVDGPGCLPAHGPSPISCRSGAGPAAAAMPEIHDAGFLEAGLRIAADAPHRVGVVLVDGAAGGHCFSSARRRAGAWGVPPGAGCAIQLIMYMPKSAKAAMSVVCGPYVNTTARW